MYVKDIKHQGHITVDHVTGIVYVQYTFMYSILILYSLCTVYLYYIVYVQYTYII